MEELGLENILDQDDIENLFSSKEKESDNNQNSDINKDSNNKSTEVNPETLFQDTPESVSSEENKESGGVSSEEKQIQPNILSSIAKALKEDGTLPDLNDDIINNIKGAEDFSKMIEDLITSKLDETQQRITEALNLNVEPSEIKRFESTIQYLNNLKEDTILDESNESLNIRKSLIFQDFINRGYSEERAKREVDKSITAGTDIEDAKEALIGNKEFYTSEYQKIIKEAKDKEIQKVKDEENLNNELKKSIIDSKVIFGKVELNSDVKRKAFEAITKPIYKDSDGNYLTAVQRYQRENKSEFLKNIGIIYTLTNGFKDVDNLISSTVKKETKNSLKELEHALNNTNRTSDGILSYTGGIIDENSYLKTYNNIDV